MCNIISCNNITANESSITPSQGIELNSESITSPYGEKIAQIGLHTQREHKLPELAVKHKEPRKDSKEGGSAGKSKVGSRKSNRKSNIIGYNDIWNNKHLKKPKEGTHAKMNTISFPEQDGPFGHDGLNKDIREAVRFSFSNQTLHNIVKPKTH